MSGKSVKRTIDSENRIYTESWEICFKQCCIFKRILCMHLMQFLLRLQRRKKPFTDDSLVKRCAIEMAYAFEDAKLAERFESVPLSHQTIQRRIIDMGEQVEILMLSLARKLLIYVRTTSKDFFIKEELFDVCSLHGTTKGKDIYDAVKKSVNRIGGLSKCSVIVTDGAPATTGNNIGLKGMLKKDGINCPMIHCLIHQGALC
ncbi:hypothetical protein PR048_020072 [Dryococelus australis]|uniref:Transposase n=1 Tax=Dryococelus australis TaxID=614101 RepID=A0ABQ9H594_9NEOP|nr:hypothetical protein PR048_020072 [Dryococelus australis]